MSFAEAGATLPLIREGKLRVLAVSSSARLPNLPDVPTFAEAAGDPDFEAGVVAHAVCAGATPKDIVLRLNGDMNAIMSDPEMQKKISGIGLMPVGTPSLDEIAEVHRRRARQMGLAAAEARPPGHSIKSPDDDQGAFGPTLRYQSKICSPVMNATSGFFRMFSKILRKYFSRCGAPMM